MLRISYYLHKSGNYHVTLWSVGQTISVTPAFFRKQIAEGRSVIVGVLEVTAETAQHIGFIVPAPVRTSAI